MALYRIPRLEKEYQELQSRLKSCNHTFCIYTPIEKGTILTQVFVRADKASRRKVDYLDGGIEIYAEQTDEDRCICLQDIMKATENLHFKVSRAYCRVRDTEYYLRPDWKYWYSLK